MTTNFEIDLCGSNYNLIATPNMTGNLKDVTLYYEDSLVAESLFS